MPEGYYRWTVRGNCRWSEATLASWQTRAGRVGVDWRYLGGFCALVWIHSGKKATLALSVPFFFFVIHNYAINNSTRALGDGGTRSLIVFRNSEWRSSLRCRFFRGRVKKEMFLFQSKLVFYVGFFAEMITHRAHQNDFLRCGAVAWLWICTIPLKCYKFLKIFLGFNIEEVLFKWGFKLDLKNYKQMRIPVARSAQG